MCLQCHLGLSDEQVTSQLKSSLDNPLFEQWNETSMSHLSIAGSGFNGPEARNIADQLFNMLVDYSREHHEIKYLTELYQPGKFMFLEKCKTPEDREKLRNHTHPAFEEPTSVQGGWFSNFVNYFFGRIN